MAVMSRRKKSIVGLMVVGVLCGVIGMVGRASALTYQDTQNVEFTFNPTMNISLSDNALVVSNLMPGSSSDSNLLTIDISTNSGYGYYLAATVGTSTQTTDLVNVENSDYTFQNLSSNVASLVNFPDNKWGYSYSTDGGTNWVSGDAGATNAGYAGLPLDNDDSGATGVKLLDVGSFVGSSSVKFKIAAKASATQASGTYTNTVNFYAVANPAPMGFNEAYAAAGKEKLNGYYQMQDATPEICAAVAEGKVGLVIDTRDDTVYHIGKLADGKCWLLDNLALDLVTYKNILDSSNTHASDATLHYLKNGGGTTSDQYAITGVEYRSSDYSNSTPLINIASKDIIPSDTISQSGGYKVGVYYNYCAASAGGYCYGNGKNYGTSSGDATEDICPKGWRMPIGGSAGEYAGLSQIMNGNSGFIGNTRDIAEYRNALRLPLSGNYSLGQASGQGSNGSFWSSTRLNDTNMFYLSVDGTISLSADYSRNNDYSVRCILDY